MDDTPGFDPAAKEAALRAESESWDTSDAIDAEPGDIPIVDVGPWFASGDQADLDAAAADLRTACETVGFHQLVGHGISTADVETLFAMVRDFHDLPIDVKSTALMDRADWPVGGVGYMPLNNRKLPTRTYGNLNEAFIVKCDEHIGFDDNQWVDDHLLPGFRSVVEAYARNVEALALRLLPLYAVALELEPGYFGDAFKHPFWRLRMTHYPPDPPGPDGAYGIPPHVDTTVFTLLLQSGPGLTLFHEQRQQWMRVPVIPDAFVVNSGELLRQWTNDRFLSTRHFANNAADSSRYAVPFFFNATADYPMACLPTCHGPGNPPKYPPISYLSSQASVQGE